MRNRPERAHSLTAAPLRALAPWLLVLTSAVLLRVPYLAGVPNPNGDEGNWLWAAHDLALGRPHALLPDGRFVPLTFARLLALAFRLAGDGIAQARAVPVLFSLFSLAACSYALRAAGLGRSALALACVLAWHPWCVAWSRTVSVPYGPVLALSLAGVTLLFSLSVSARSFTPRALLAWALAWQCLGFALHGSPLAVVPIFSVALWALRDRAVRTRWRSFGYPALLATIAGVIPHIALIAGGALEVASRGATRPRHYFTALPARLHTYARAVLGGIDGEATARHFAGVSSPPFVEALAALCALALLLYALVALRTPRSVESRTLESLTLTRALRALSATWIACALLGVPLLLAPVRQWNMPAVDAERYAFCFVAPAALALAALASDPRRRLSRSAFVLALALLVPTARTAHALFAGAGVDRGAWLLLDGGAYRGWRTPRERQPLVTLLRSELLAARRTPGEPVELLVADYALHPLHYALREDQIYPVDVTKFTATHRPGARVFYALYCRDVFSLAYTPTTEPAANRALRLRMEQSGTEPRLVRRFEERDGRCLAELYEAGFSEPPPAAALGVLGLPPPRVGGSR